MMLRFYRHYPAAGSRRVTLNYVLHLAGRFHFSF